MSVFNYREAEKIWQEHDPSVDTLIMAAIRKADAFNLQMIRACWPHLVDEFYYRYNSGAALMPGEVGYDPEMDDNIRIQAEQVISEGT